MRIEAVPDLTGYPPSINNFISCCSSRSNSFLFSNTSSTLLLSTERIKLSFFCRLYL
uniref:Uncharacterized protein n=1 Tax=Echeneis naucrates TaxID=173247 RepID=A0A665UJR2_ECHNA